MKRTRFTRPYQDLIKFTIDEGICQASYTIAHANASGYIIVESTLKLQKKILAFFGKAAQAI
jgi:hypothetical protein